MDEGRGIYSVAMFHVGAKSALLRRLFMPMAKKTSSARSLAPPFQIEPTSLGFDLVLGANPEVSASILFRYSISAVESKDFTTDVFVYGFEM